MSENKIFSLTGNDFIKLERNIWASLAAAFRFLGVSAEEECTHELDLFKKIPYFIAAVSCIDVFIYYLTEDKTKRNLIFDSHNDTEAWQFLTYMLVHKDCVHLFLNVIIQGFLGYTIEGEQGTWRCATVYLSGGLAASLGTKTFSPPTLMAGASGGIYALLTSHFANIILNYEAIRSVGYRASAAVILVFFDVIHVICHIRYFNNENPRIEYMAHVFGAISGLASGFMIFSGNSEERRKIQIASSLVLLLAVTGSCVYYHRRTFLGNANAVEHRATLTSNRHQKRLFP